MTRTGIALLLTAAAFAQSPAHDALKINEQGNAASDAGNYAEAAARYREAIEIWRTLGPDYKAHLAASTMNLGTVLCAEGRRVEGAAAFTEALALHRAVLGPHHKRTLINMTLLASDYLMLGELQQVQAILDEALPLARAEFSSDVQLARCLEIQSGLLNRHGKAKEAIAPAEEALRIAIQTAGEDSLETGLAYSAAAEALRTAGQQNRALPLYRKARAVYEKFLGPEHPRVASLWSQEGLIQMDEGKLSTAEQSMLKAIELLKKTCPDCAVEMAVAESNLGLLRLKQKRYREADEIFSQAVNLRERLLPTAVPELAQAIENLAYTRRLEHRDQDAEQLAQRAAGMMAAFR
jgi:tetratricopeptide (TPR) repeat protein